MINIPQEITSQSRNENFSNSIIVHAVRDLAIRMKDNNNGA
jgi:hypothetical protein